MGMDLLAGGRVRGASASGGSGRGSGACSGDSGGHPTSVSPLASSDELKRPFASAANATSERSVSPQRERRKRYGTFALRNARLQLIASRVHLPVAHSRAALPGGLFTHASCSTQPAAFNVIDDVRPHPS